MSEWCPLINQDGVPLVKWIQAVSGTCVYGNISAMSWLFGCVSFCCWLGAQLPQVAENYVNQSVEGLSFGFLLNWFIGDFTNLLGCILTHQLPFQTALAFYYVCVDVVLGLQYLYYSRLDERRRVIRLDGHTQILEVNRYGHDGQLHSDSEDSNVVHNKSIPIPKPQSETTDFAASRTPSWANPKALLTSSFVASFSRVNAAPIYAANIVTSNSSSGHSAETIGKIMAWICTAMYLISRLPQIYKNYRRKSTWGTSLLLFMATFSGNTTYTLSILLSPEARGVNRSEFLMNETPFLIGSAGTVIFDVIIFIQNYLYGRQSPYTTLASYSNGDQLHDPDNPTKATSTSVHPVIIGESRFHPKDTTPLAYSLQTNYSD
jgi:solute carrier family 66 (lysosomal lysine-arginine transporter), member 1